MGRNIDDIRVVRPMFGVSLVAVATYLSIEVLACCYFHYVIPSSLRQSVYYVVSGEDSLPPSKIESYLWANYRPNPESSEVNEFGWRYGGGPKEDGIFRILCIGGSTTWSDKVTNSEESYPARLEHYLQNQGYHVDVVNGGAPYFTSAELVGTLAFRGIYTDPDLVVIHTGGNDTAPLRSPEEYKPDYTHWRTVDPNIVGLTKNNLFQALWNIPSWTYRLYLIHSLQPNAFFQQQVGKQVTSSQEGLLADNYVFDREPIGLENNLRTLVAISQGHGADVVGITFNPRYDKVWMQVPLIKEDPDLESRVIERLRWSMDETNETIRDVCFELGVPVIDFDEFETTRPEFWVDSCHLTVEGIEEKAEFIGDQLIESQVLPLPFDK